MTLNSMASVTLKVLEYHDDGRQSGQSMVAETNCKILVLPVTCFEQDEPIFYGFFFQTLLLNQVRAGKSSVRGSFSSGINRLNILGLICNNKLDVIGVH